MLQIKYNNEFLDIASGTDHELEANSPMFLMDNLLAEYSTPLTIVYSDKNARLIGPLFFSLTVKKKTKLPVELYKDQAYRCNATLVIESAALKSSTRNANASGYLLTGISSFFSLIKDALCNELNLGTYTKAYTSAEPLDTSRGIGYWQDFQQSWTGTMDFVCAPILNDNLYGEGSGAMMNALGRFVTNDPVRTWGQPSNPFGGYYNGNYNNTNGETGRTYSTYNILQTPFAPVFPQLFLKVAFNKIFASVGWTIDASLVDDYDKMVVFSNYKVDTYIFPEAGVPRTQATLPHGSVPSVSFKYADLLPKNTKASSFILAICKRYGWVPLCNTETKSCVLFPLKLVDAGALKDWTQYAEPGHDSDFSADDKSYAFKNNFTGNDAIASEPDISALDQSLVVDSKNNLPTATDSYDNSAVFCIRENAWYGIDVTVPTDGSLPQRFWKPVKDNIYNDEPEGATDSFETDCTTLAMAWNKYTTDKWGLFPYCSQPFNQEAGIRTLFYYGLIKERLVDGTEGEATYPYLSSTRFLPDGSAALSWSNVFKAPGSDGHEYGIEQYWFAKWVAYMKLAEIKTQNFNLPLVELVNFKWNDLILINNIPHLVVSYIEKLSQQNFIQAKLKRLYKEF